MVALFVWLFSTERFQMCPQIVRWLIGSYFLVRSAGFDCDCLTGFIVNCDCLTGFNVNCNCLICFNVNCQKGETSALASGQEDSGDRAGDK